LQAQFYLAEIDRRQAEIDRQKGAWIAQRDFWMDVTIIILIIGELIFGYIAFREGAQQTRVLEELQRSTSATAKTLVALEATTERMNGAIQAELALSSRIALDIVFDGGILNITNKGPVNVALHGWRINRSQPVMEEQPIILIAGMFSQVHTGAYEELRKLAENHARLVLPLELYLEANDGTEYIATGDLVGGRAFTGVIKMKLDRLLIAKGVWRHKQK